MGPFPPSKEEPNTPRPVPWWNSWSSNTYSKITPSVTGDSLRVKKWFSPSGSFVKLIANGDPTDPLECDAMAKVKVFYTSSEKKVHNFHYQVIARGSIIKTGLKQHFFQPTPWDPSDFNGDNILQPLRPLEPTTPPPTRTPPTTTSRLGTTDENGYEYEISTNDTVELLPSKGINSFEQFLKAYRRAWSVKAKIHAYRSFSTHLRQAHIY